MESFDSQATAAVLHSGATASLAAHGAAIMTLLPLSKGGFAAWIAFSSLLAWGASIYLAIRVKIDAGFFELLATHPPEQLDLFLKTTGLRNEPGTRTILDRQRGAVRLWRMLIASVAVEIVLLLLAILFWIA